MCGSQVRRERNGVSPKLPLETPSNGHCKSHTQEWQHNIDSCTVTASTSRDPLLESGPNQSPKTGKGTENTTDPSNPTGHYPVGSNEKEFMEYLLALAIQHETEDDSDYQIVRSREVCVFFKCNVLLSTHFISFEILKKEYVCHIFKEFALPLCHFVVVLLVSTRKPTIHYII